MEDITRKTTAQLIDELISTNLKCWFAQEQVCQETDPELVAEAAKLAQATNARRNALIRAIDARLGETLTSLPKTYV